MLWHKPGGSLVQDKPLIFPVGKRGSGMVIVLNVEEVGKEQFVCDFLYFLNSCINNVPASRSVSSWQN
jgi:hypothetical protein